MEGTLTVTVGRRVVVHSYTAPRTGWFATSHVIELPDRLVVVDLPLLAAHTAEVLARVGDLAKPVDRVLVTHAHPDHFAGTTLVDAPVHATAGVRDLVNTRGAAAVRSTYRHQRIGQVGTARSPHVGHVLADGRVSLGGVELDLRRFGPGDCPENLVVEVVGESMVFTGDLVSHGVHPYVGERHAGAWAASLRRLRELRHDVVLPGHGPPGTAALYDQMARYLETARFVLASAGTADDVEHALCSAHPGLLGTPLRRSS